MSQTRWGRTALWALGCLALLADVTQAAKPSKAPAPAVKTEASKTRKPAEFKPMPANPADRKPATRSVEDFRTMLKGRWRTKCLRERPTGGGYAFTSEFQFREDGTHEYTSQVWASGNCGDANPKVTPKDGDHFEIEPCPKEKSPWGGELFVVKLRRANAKTSVLLFGTKPGNNNALGRLNAKGLSTEPTPSAAALCASADKTRANTYRRIE